MSVRPQVPGAPYHLLARTTDHRWWRPLVELLVFIVAWAVIGGVMGAVIMAITSGDALELDGEVGLVAIGLTLGSATLATLFAARVMGRAPGMVSSVIGRLRWRWLAWCSGIFLIATIVAIGVLFAVELIAPSAEVPGASEDAWPGLATFAPQLALILLIVPLQAAGEEYAIRGTLLQVLGAWVRPAWFSIVITSLVFAAMHLPESAAVWIVMLSTGVATAWLSIRTGGLEAAIALHVASNVVSFVLGAATGGFGDWAKELNTDVPLGPAVWWELCLWGGVVIVVRRARRIGLATTVSAPPPA